MGEVLPAVRCSKNEEEPQAERFEDATLLALKKDPGAKECRWPLEVRKGKEMDSP